MPQLVEEGDEERAEDRSFLAPLLKKASLVLYALSLAAIIALRSRCSSPLPPGRSGKPISIAVDAGAPSRYLIFIRERRSRGPSFFSARATAAGAVSRRRSARALQSTATKSSGSIPRRYARPITTSPFCRPTSARSRKGGDALRNHPPPVILGGWSMGAAQAIAAAGGPHPPPGLAGVLLLDPCSRGRYGLRLSDQSDMLPTGPGTFSMEEFTQTMGNLHVVQWHAAQDSIDSRAWLELLTAPHKEYRFRADGTLLQQRPRRFSESARRQRSLDFEPGAAARSA